MDELAGCVRNAYGLAVDGITFLPLGADVNTAVFRVVAGEADYFLKLRSGMNAVSGLATTRKRASAALSTAMTALTCREWLMLK